MSQVIVTNDRLRAKREKSRDQERRISREESFQRWHRSDVTGPDPVKRAVGLAVLPVLALWGLIGGVMTAALTVTRGLFRFLGKLLGGRRNLITGRE